MGNVLGSADPLEQVPAFQRHPPPMRTLAETAEGTVLAKTRPADDPARERIVEQLETHFSGELALTAGKGKGAPSTPAASAAVYVPRGDSGTRGLVDDPAQDETQRSGTTVLVVKVCHDHDLPARFCLSPTPPRCCQGAGPAPERLYMATGRGRAPPSRSALVGRISERGPTRSFLIRGAHHLV